MSKDLVQFTSDAGEMVKLTAQDIRQYICENATEKEVGLFLAHCAAHKLDPIGSKDAYLVKYGNSPASIITAYQVFNRRARSFPDYAGINSGVVTLKPDGTVQHKKGSAVYPEIDGKLIGGWAEVYVDGWKVPAYTEVSMADYSTGKSNWAKMPGVMIEKVAKAAAWRLAYPSEFSGMYTAEEMDQAKPRETEQNAAEQPIRTEVVSVEPLAIEEPKKPITADLSAISERKEAFMSRLGYTASDVNRVLCEYVGVRSLREATPEQVNLCAQYMDDIINTPVIL